MIIASSAASDQSTDSGDPVDAAVVAPAPGDDRFGDLV